jgi:hypothetical protein
LESSKVLREVSEAARRLYYEDDLSVEDLKHELSPEAYQLLKKAEKHVKSDYPYWDWDDIAGIYETGLSLSSRIEGKYFHATKIADYWYLNENGEIQNLAIPLPLTKLSTRLSSKWVHKTDVSRIIEHLEEIIDEAHPLSRAAINKEIDKWMRKL